MSLKESLEHLVDKVEDIFESGKDKLKDAKDKVGDAVQDGKYKIEDAKDKVGDAVQDGKYKIEDAKDKVGDAVQDGKNKVAGVVQDVNNRVENTAQGGKDAVTEFSAIKTLTDLANKSGIKLEDIEKFAKDKGISLTELVKNPAGQLDEIIAAVKNMIK